MPDPASPAKPSTSGAHPRKAGEQPERVTERTPAWLVARLLDRSKRLDYILMVVIGAAPLLAERVLLGGRRTGFDLDDDYITYLESFHQSSLVVLLPLLLFAFRLMMAKVVPVVSAWPPPRHPPIVDLVRGESARREVYRKLRRRVLSNRNLLAPIAIVLIVLVADAAASMQPYWTDDHWERIGCAASGTPGTSASAQPQQCRWRDSWYFAFETGEIGKGGNLLLLALAALAQSCAVFIGILAIVLFLRHNLFFVGNVYQRRWARGVVGGTDTRFHIDPTDVDRCFGFRIANVAFNAQVQALMIAGAAMLVSRAMSVHFGSDAANDPDVRWYDFVLDLEFPVPGQWLMALSWLVALGVVALPASVKLLPRVPGHGAARTELSVGNYLREFFSDETWPRDKLGRGESERVVAARFARNSFWPTGDNRARVLFFVAFWIFFFILQPPPLRLDAIDAMALGFVVYTVLAFLARWALFAALEASLRYVDEMLVAKGAAAGDDLPASASQRDGVRDRSVFISYRRRDSAPYARALLQELLTEFDHDRVFMDITDIGPGEDFADRIERELDGVDAVVVLIGPLWLDIEDGQARRRLENPEDLVRLEVATALRLGKSVFPVLVGGAAMPAASALPEPLRALARRNAVEISDTRWSYDVGRLVDALATN